VIFDVFKLQGPVSIFESDMGINKNLKPSDYTIIEQVGIVTN
jgi:hypothetical protein